MILSGLEVPAVLWRSTIKSRCESFKLTTCCWDIGKRRWIIWINKLLEPSASSLEGREFWVHRVRPYSRIAVKSHPSGQSEVMRVLPPKRDSQSSCLLMERSGVFVVRETRNSSNDIPSITYSQTVPDESMNKEPIYIKSRIHNFHTLGFSVFVHTNTNSNWTTVWNRSWRVCKKLLKWTSHMFTL